MPTTNKKQIDNAYVIAKYYGFEKLNIKDVEQKEHTKAKKIKNQEDFKHNNLQHIEELVSVLSFVNTKKEPELPMLFYTKGEIKTTKRKKTPNNNIGLHIIGTKKSIAEAILIKTAFAILNEEGYKNLVLEINSIGNRESQINFNKALTVFFRSKLDDLNAKSKHLLKFGGHTLISSNSKELQKLLPEAPSSIEFLSEESRKHFKEVIEYLESQDIPFNINKDVIGDPHYSTNTVFKIIDTKSNKILAAGTRYNDLSKRTIARKGQSAVSVNIDLPKLKTVPESREPDLKKCDIYFIQLGYAAKLKSLEVIEILRKSKINVHHAIGRDKMSTQTEFANRNHVKYILLLGQREAKDHTVCVRDLDSNSQITIPVEELVETLAKLRKKNKN